MIRTLRRLLPLVLAAGLTACGDAPSREGVSPVRGCAGKPAPPVGTLAAEIVDRPFPGRAVVEVRWTRGARGEVPTVDLALPDGAWLVSGRRSRAMTGNAPSGVFRYEVGYRPGEALDVVARLRARTGDRESAREACVRLESPEAGR